jgi:hypothetical protein
MFGSAGRDSFLRRVVSLAPVTTDQQIGARPTGANHPVPFLTRIPTITEAAPFWGATAAASARATLFRLVRVRAAL